MLGNASRKFCRTSSLFLGNSKWVTSFSWVILLHKVTQFYMFLSRCYNESITLGHATLGDSVTVFRIFRRTRSRYFRRFCHAILGKLTPVKWP